MKLLTTLLAAIVLFVSFPADSFAVWFDSSWTYRVSITVDASKVPSTQTSFPVYVDLSDLPSDFHTNVKSDGCDIRVVESDETTETAFELVDYDATTDTGELHFMADSLDGITDTVFYIYYGNSGASCYGVTATYGRNAVWSGKEIISHDGGVTDSTGNGNASNGGGITSGGATGKIGDATYYSGASNAYVNFSNRVFGNSHTMAFWMKTPSGGGIQVPQRSVDGGDYFMSYNRQDISPKKFQARANYIGSTYSTFDPFDNTWRRYVYTVSGATISLYIDGQFESSVTNSTHIGSTMANNYFGGEIDLTRRYFTGTLDEIVSDPNHWTANWITTEYNNQSSPSTFYTVGTQETDGGTPRKRAIQIIGYSQRHNYIV